MVHRLLLGQLGRIAEDDRDHFGKKRMDMAGPLMAASFAQLFRKVMLLAELVGGRGAVMNCSWSKTVRGSCSVKWIVVGTLISTLRYEAPRALQMG